MNTSALMDAKTKMDEDQTRRRRVIRANVGAVRDRIAAAAERSGRTADDVRLVAVTKYVDAETTRELFAAGCHDLAENRPQAFWRKADALGDLAVRWHFIGHLQRNKLRRTLPHVWMLHAGDSLRLLQAIEEQWDARASVLDALLEVNISGEATKHGVAPQDCGEVLDAASAWTHVRIQGLMCMAGLAGGPAGSSRDFHALRELRDQLQPQFPRLSLRELSMGMSGDFEAAIAAGATIVRIGSLLFEGLS